MTTTKTEADEVLERLLELLEELVRLGAWDRVSSVEDNLADVWLAKELAEAWQ